jgi:hypothetical protein
VVGKGTSAAERELARHTANSKVAERARIGRQEDMHYALDQYRRQQQGERLTTVEQEWAALGATLSPAKVLGYGAGAAVEENDGEDDDELDGLLDAILSQYDCYEEDAMDALEATADEEGWNLDAAIALLVEQGVEAFSAGEDSDGGKYSDAEGDESPGKSSEDDDRGRDGGRSASATPNRERGAMNRRGEALADRGGEHMKKNRFSVLGESKTSGAGNRANSLQLRYRGRSAEPALGSTDEENLGGGEKADAVDEFQSPRRISAAGGMRNLRGYEFAVRQVQRALTCDDATARLLLMDKRARSEAGGFPDVAKAVKLFYEGQKEGGVKKGSQAAVEAELARVKSTAGTLHSMVLPSLTLPDWDVGKAPEGGFTYPTFRRIYALFQKYQRQTNFATTVTLKSLVTANLRPTIEARCGLGKSAWKEVSEGGMEDAEFIKKVQETLKPVRAMEFEVLFEGMRLKHPGNETDILSTVEEWGEKWLSTEREAEEQGIILQPGKMKELFKKAIQPIQRVSRLILGEQFHSTAEWYTLIIRELRMRQSYAAEADRDGKHGSSRHWRGYSNQGHESSYGSSRGRGGVGRGARPDGGHQIRRDSHGEGREEAQFNNHSGGTEPMTYQPAGRGRGRSDRGESYARGRGDPQGAGRGGRGRGVDYPSRGDAKGAGRNAEPWGNRQPINDPRNEEQQTLTKGKWWHDSRQENLCCKDANCGQRQDVPFCQGCGQHHHGREWCYKSKEEGFNATGYWCDNRKGRAPLASRTGRPFGAPPTGRAFGAPPTARFNHMGSTPDGDADGLHSGAGLA